MVTGQVSTTNVFQHYPKVDMMWHTQFRQTEKPHDDSWYQDTEENIMKEYINRHYDDESI